MSEQGLAGSRRMAGRVPALSIGGVLRAAVELIRAALLAALPVVMLVVSPQRVVLSLEVAAIYLVAGLLLARLDRSDRPALLYGVAAAGLIGLELLRLHLAGPTPDLKRYNPMEWKGGIPSYAVAKGMYFTAVVVPFGVAVAILARRIEHLWPAAAAAAAVGIAVAVPTVIHHNVSVLGASRYQWQGDLLALATLVLLQGWVLRKIWLSMLAALVTMAAVGMSNSRQSVVAIAVGLPLMAVYWFLAWRRNRGRVPAATWALPALAWALAGGLMLAWIYLTYLKERHIRFLFDRLIQDPAVCLCTTTPARFIALFGNTGERDKLVVHGWHDFAANPLLGGGLGSYVFPARDYRYPHNLLLELGGEIGLVGAAILLVPIVYALAKLAAAGIQRGGRAEATLLAVVLMFAVVSSLSGDLPSDRGLFIFAIPALKFGFLSRSPKAPAPAVSGG